MTVKIKEEYGDDLAVVMVECQGADEQGQLSMAAQKKWLGRDLMWTSERPFNTGAGGLPNFALVDEAGKIVLMGNPLSMHSQIEEEIEAALKRAKKGPEDLPKCAEKVRDLRVKGSWAKAASTLVKERERADADELPALEAEGAELERAFGARLAQVEWLLQNGYPLRAEELVGELEKGAKGDDDLTARVEPLVEKVGAAEEELEAAKGLAKLERALYEDGPDEKLAERLEKLAEKHEGTRVAARAQRLAGWARPSSAP